MASTTTTNTAIQYVDERENVQAKRLWWAGPVTAVAAAIAAVIVREIGVLVSAVPPDLMLLQEPSVAISTIVFVLVGTLVFAGIIRFARRPVHTFRVVAAWALVLSLFSPITAGLGWSPFVTIGPATVAATMLMHVAAGLVTIPLLPALARAK
jgi:pheromone shutdown protein TraB